MSKTIGWARRLKVAADAKGLIGHAGAVLLRRCADQVGLTSGLSGALRVRGRSPGWDRGVVLVQLAVAICLGATAMADIALLDHQAAVFGAAPSDSTVRRMLAELDGKTVAAIAKARARVRAHVWDLLAGHEAGFCVDCHRRSDRVRLGRGGHGRHADHGGLSQAGRGGHL